MSAVNKLPRGVFITGTDTGVGKTIVAAALARYLANRNMNINVMKPVESGVNETEGLGPDAALLQWAARSETDLNQICPYRLKAPLAPSIAAQKEQVFIDFTHLVETAKNLMSIGGFTIIEGAGGLMTPLTGGLLIADLARAIGLPLLVVTTPRLGTINHTLLTIFTAQQMGISVAGYLVNRMPARPGEAEEGAPHALASLASSDILGVLPEISGSNREIVEELAGRFDNLPTLPWLLNALGVA